MSNYSFKAMYKKVCFPPSLYTFFIVAVDNLCTQASKLMLAAAWDSLGSAGSRSVSFVVSLSFKSSLNWDQTVAGRIAVE